MSAMVSQTTSLKIVDWTVYSGADQRKHQLRVTGSCEGNSPMAGEFPAQRASNAENVSIWWRHHGEAYHIEAWRRLYSLVDGLIIDSSDSLSSARRQTLYCIRADYSRVELMRQT